METSPHEPPPVPRSQPTAPAGAPPPPEIDGWFSRLRMGLLAKCLGIGLLILVLQVPLLFIDSLGRERERRRNEAIADITSRWGNNQEIAGPILAVPYLYQVSEYEGSGRDRREVTREYQATAYFLPDQLCVESTLDTETRKRGIYSTAVYNSRMSLRGRFSTPKLQDTGAKPSQVLWEQARMIVCIADVQGLRAAPAWEWAGLRKEWQPGTNWNIGKQGLHTPLGGMPSPGQALAFDISLELNGSRTFAIAPLARETRVAMSSAWPDPSFMGAWLPEKRSVGKEGFSASWTLSYLARRVPQQWTDAETAKQPSWRDVSDTAVGVSLLQGTNAYQTQERATKHGILILALVFTAFFLFESTVLRGLPGLHYLLVGGALCLFYLALLALSEFTSFPVAYGVAASLSILLITLHSAATLRTWKRAAIILVELLAVYGYLFFVLRMQDYALLAGTSALFAALAAVMWCTRKVGRD